MKYCELFRISTFSYALGMYLFVPYIWSELRRLTVKLHPAVIGANGCVVLRLLFVLFLPEAHLCVIPA